MALLNDEKKNGNPKAASVRIQSDTVSGYSGQRRHDLRIGPQPKYVDPERSHLNRTLLEPPLPAVMKAIATKRRAKRETQRAMKSNSAMDLSRFDAAPVAHLSYLSLEGQGAFPAEGRVAAAWIVEAVDVFEDGNFGITTRSPGPLPQ